MKSFLGYIANKIVQSTPRSKKVGPTIKSVKPNLKKTVQQTKSDEYVKRIRALEGAEKKIKSGKEMIKEGQKARKNMIDTKKAFQFKHGKSTHAIKPGDKPEVKYKGNVREQKMGGGMMGRRFGLKKGTNLGMQSVKYGLDNNPKITAADPKAKFIAANKKKKSKSPMDKQVRKA
jgi:hypothetical protein